MAKSKANISRVLNSIGDLAGVATIIADQFAELVTEHAQEFMRDYIQQHVYNEGLGNGNFYQRTYELVDAVVARRNSSGRWSVFIDGRMINASRASDPEFWNQNMSWGEASQSGALPEYIESGNNSPLYSYEGINYIEATEEYINSNIYMWWNNFI